MSNGLSLACEVCGFEGLDDGDDGFFYCQRCGSQSQEVRDTQVDTFDIIEGGNTAAAVRRRAPAPFTVVKTEPSFQSQPLSQFWGSLRNEVEEDDHKGNGNGVGPTEPSDFGAGSRLPSYEDYYTEIRLRYVMGVQIMIELQVKALVEKFNVNPLIVGIVEPIWLNFVASTKVFADDWADEIVRESESQAQGEIDEVGYRAIHRAEPRNILGKRAVMIWYQSLSKTIPLTYSLVISFLACHLAREAILPTDIVKWSVEGKLPYFAAYVELEKQIGSPSNACPLSSNRMFRPIRAISLQKLESLAASVAKTIGLQLPPVDFYAIASRYLGQLSLPVEKILPHACRIYEYSMPPELWLSANKFRLPTRCCVMSILIVSIRILYKINGFGEWEKSLSRSSGLSSSANQKGKRTKAVGNTDMKDGADQQREMEPTSNIGVNEDAMLTSPTHNFDSLAKEPCNSQSNGQQTMWDAAELILSLEAKYNELVDTHDYSKDLPTYLQYCKDVVFAGIEPSFEDHEEEKVIEDLWDIYQKEEAHKLSDANVVGSSGPTCGNHKRPRDDCISKPEDSKKFRDDGCSNFSSPPEDCSKDDDSEFSMSSDDCSQLSVQSYKKRAIRRMKSNMEENRFCYISPKVYPKSFDYLHYRRKKGDGAYAYAAHADYYILLRSCARVAQLDVRTLHTAVLNFEKKLENPGLCLKVKPSADNSEFSTDDVEGKLIDDCVDLSKLNL